AWAVTEHLHNVIGCKTIFATHYHELTQLTEELAHARNFNVAVREAGDEVVFLHRLEPGGADRSYGIHVGRLAGLPDAVVERAWRVLKLLEAGHHVAHQSAPPAPDARPLSRRAGWRDGQRRRRAAAVRRLDGATRGGVALGRRVERVFRARLGGALGREAPALRPPPAARPGDRNGVPAADRVPPPHRGGGGDRQGKTG